jgi:hypothetical protein
LEITRRVKAQAGYRGWMGHAAQPCGFAAKQHWVIIAVNEKDFERKGFLPRRMCAKIKLRLAAEIDAPDALALREIQGATSWQAKFVNCDKHGKFQKMEGKNNNNADKLHQIQRIWMKRDYALRSTFQRHSQLGISTGASHVH